MSNNIVTVTITQQVGSAPSVLQQTGAIVSQGGTTLAAGTTALITQPSDLTAILSGAEVISSMAWSTGVVTVTTTTPHGIPVTDVVQGVISGVTPTGYNGTFAITSTGASTFTYPLVTNPGSMTIAGSFTLEDVFELFSQVNTFFAQGNSLAVYVLELGVGTTAQGVTALQTYINTTTAPKYAYLIPKEWDIETTAPTMFKLFASPTSKVYFYVSTTVATYTNWANIKSVLALAPSPLAPITEFSAAAQFYIGLHNAPSSSAMGAQMPYSYVYGVTDYVTLTNAQSAAFKAAGVSWIGDGANGGISNTLIVGGTYMDLNPFSYWYTVDWVNINQSIDLNAAVINGSQPGLVNPLLYNQQGINALQKVAQNRMNIGVSFGLILAPVTVAAVPFTTYIAQNPSAYAAGTYAGLSSTFVPARGFTAITLNLTASNIPT